MDAALQAWFERQHGVATTAQAIEHGESFETIERRVANNDWWRPMPRVVAPVGVPLTFEGRLSAAALSIGGDLAFGGATAAAIWRLPGADPPQRLHVVVADTRQGTRSPAVHVQRRSALLEHTFLRDGWPVVPVENALLGCVPAMTFPELVDSVQDLLRLRRTSVRRLEVAAGRGIKGSVALAAALAVAGDGMGSKWERRLAHLLRAPGRPNAKAPLRVVSPAGLVAYIDLAFPEVKLAIEIDGYVAHSRPRAFRYDRKRQNELVAELGWTLLRYTPYEIATRPERIVAQVWRLYDRLAVQAA